MMERWRDIPGLHGYQASDHGRIRSVDRTITDKRGHTYRVRGTVRSPTLSRGGYLRFNVTGGTRPVHRAVLEAFVGPCPLGHHGAHSDGDRINNWLFNLRWASAVENAADKERHGTAYRPQGENHPLAKLTDTAVATIRRRCAAGERQAAVARDLGIDARLVGKIVRREAWRHVTADDEQNGVVFSDPDAEAA